MSVIILVLKSYRLYIIVACLLGIFIRLYGLDIQGLWFDELVMSFVGISHDPEMLKILSINDLHPPLYLLFLYNWIQVFGSSEIIIRLPSAIAGILAIVFMYILSKEIFNRYITASATILISLSNAAIYYSQEARNYSFVLLFSTILTLYWLNLLKKINKSEITIKEFIIYALICIFTSYLHYFGALIVAFQLIYLFIVSIKTKNYVKEVLVLGLIVAFVFLPWVFKHYSYIKVIGNGQFWIPKPDIINIGSLLDFVFNIKLVIFLFIPFIISLFKKELLPKIKQLNLADPPVALLYISLIPVLAVFLISQFVPVFYPRYFIVILPSAYLLISILISFNPSFNGIKSTIYVFVISLVSLFLFLFVSGNNISESNKTFYQLYKQQWREASKYVMDNYTDKTVIFTDRHPFLYAYYFNRFKKNPDSIKINYYNFPIIEKDLDILSEQFDKLYFFSTFEQVPQIMISSLEKRCKRYEKKDFSDIFVYECVLK